MTRNIRVVGINYQKPTFLQALKRETIGKLLSGLALGLGYIWISFDKNKQGWHDKIAKTYVVQTQLPHREPVESQINKKSFLPLGLLLAGTVEIILSLIIFTGLPQTARLLNVIIGFSIAQLFYGIILIVKQKKSGTLQPLQRKIAIILIGIGLITFTYVLSITFLYLKAALFNITNFIK